VTVITNSENRGFPIAANQGMRAAKGQQILLLNNDTIVTTGWLRRMLRALESHPRIGLVGPCSNNVSGSQYVTVQYDELESLDGFAWDWGKSHARVVADTDRLVGFCLLIRREVVERIGLLDERFSPGNFEDDDYCLRALDAGFRAVIARDAFVHHFAGRTFLGTDIRFGELLAEKQQLFREKLREKELERCGITASQQHSRAEHVPTNAKYGIRVGTEGALFLERSPVRLSLCLIMRDNERTIGPCLKSIRHRVDEMVCVDTGSKDSTPEIAKRLGARVFHFPWCDSFSAARNESFRHARGDWILVMDSDDTIDEPNGRKIRELILRQSDPSFMGYTVKVHCPSMGENGELEVTVVDQVHLVRNLPELRWDRRIHEQIIPAIRRAGGEVGFTDLFIVHSGSDRSSEGQQRKLERDLRLLNMELEEYPDHPFTLFNLGMTYRDARQYDKAVDYLKRSIERSGENESHLRKAYALLVSSHTLWGQYKPAYETCQVGLRLFPEDTELRFQEGGLLNNFGRYAEAVEAYLKVLATDEGAHFASVERGIKGYLTRHNLAVVYMNMGDLARAEEQWRLVVAEVPTYRTAWRCLGDVLVRQGKQQEAAVLVDGLLSDPRLRSTGMLVQAQLTAARGDLAAARHELEQAAAACPGDVEPLRELWQFLLKNAAPAEAEGVLKELIMRAPDDASAHHDLGTLYLQMGEPASAADSLRESLRYRPDCPATLLNLGFALKQAGRPDEAVATWRRILATAPADASAARAHREIDQLSQAELPCV
jgi:tetratricopeptide (TPR) repeat protein